MDYCEEKRNRIHRLKLDDGTWIIEDSDLRSEALRFYQNPFCANEIVNLNALHIRDHPRLSEDVVSVHLAPVLKEEVHVAMINMQSFNAPGLDGFKPFFFKHYWHLIGDDLWRLVQNAFSYGCFDPRLAEILITLIPKGENLTHLRNF